MKIRDSINKIRVSLAQRHISRGEKYLELGLVEKSIKSCANSFKVGGELDGAHNLLCRALMPGDDYLKLISYFHKFLGPKNYVEIGVFEGRSLALAGAHTNVIGIDPCMQVKNEIISPAKLFSLTSDDFFEFKDLLAEMRGENFDLGFIDGAHLFENTLKDFINLERYSGRSSLVLVHDCLPITRLVASRNRTTSFWTGDVWKIIPCLRKYRPDLNIHVIPSRPSGLGLITNLNSTSEVLSKKYNQIVEEYRDQELDYEHLDGYKMKQLDLLPNDWNQISGVLPVI